MTVYGLDAALAAALPGTVVAGSLHRREYQVY